MSSYRRKKKKYTNLSFDYLLYFLSVKIMTVSIKLTLCLLVISLSYVYGAIKPDKPGAAKAVWKFTSLLFFYLIIG